MELVSQSFRDGAPIPSEFAFGKHDPKTHVALAQNRNPHLAWRGAPAGTKSFALICHDGDVPTRGDDVNQEGRTVPFALPRTDFFHWVLIDIPASRHEIKAGELSDGVTARGKKGPETGVPPMRQGLNDYTGWFAGDEAMRGDYFGYDGPCPPWNDERGHRYHFTIYALNVERLPVEGKFDGAQTRRALEAHVLAKASLMGSYHIFPEAVLPT